MLEGTVSPIITHELESQIDAQGNLLVRENLLHSQLYGRPPYYFRPIQ